MVFVSNSGLANEKIETVDAFAIDTEAFRFTDSAGETMQLASYDGEWVIVNFWAVWCTPCVAELPSLSAFQQHFDERITVLPLAQGNTSHAELSTFLNDLDIENLPSLRDEKSASFRLAKARGLPTSLVINPRGEVIAKIEGEIDWMGESVLTRFENWLQN